MKIGIIGHGRFGKLWTELMSEFGEVVIFDKEKGIRSKEKFNNVCDVDILFLLVPISEIKNVCKQISNKLNKETIVIDACSVKVKPVKEMKQILKSNQPIIATHPLFGPDSVKRFGLAGQKIVVSNVRSTEKQLKLLKNILKKLRLKIIEATPEEHDKQMAKSQALVHFFGRGLAELKLKKQEIFTPDYESLLKINDLVNNDTWQLFFDMQLYNPYAKKIRKDLLVALKNLDSKL
ncbi:MAG TPA: prephenate dehydrogenase/arogenate dehydrogenase family protein [Candidatus Magasanikbacteria bacterium]|nr:prephenate dehydrogenase/arogenate dehydrogenase family protein [Candidatus Magasanikbacteria bacterium]